MKQLLSYEDEPEGHGRGAFVLQWVESIVKTRLATNQDGSVARINKPSVEQTEERWPYGSSQERAELQAKIDRLKR